MKTFWNISGSLNAIKEWQPNCWIQVTCPTEAEQQELGADVLVAGNAVFKSENPMQTIIDLKR